MNPNLLKLSYLVSLKQRKYETELKILENNKQDLFLELQKVRIEIDKIDTEKQSYRLYVYSNLFKGLVSDTEIETAYYKFQKFEDYIITLRDEQNIIKDKIVNIEEQISGLTKQLHLCIVKEEKYDYLRKLYSKQII